MMRQFHTVDRSRKTLRPTHVVTVAVTQEAPPALRNGSQYCRNSENCLFGNPGDDDTPAASAPQTSASKSASKLRFRILNIFILRVCINVFFLYIGIFFSSGRGPFLVLSALGHAGSPPEHHGANVGPDRGPWHVLWGFKVASNHREAFRARRAIQAHSNPRTG